MQVALIGESESEGTEEKATDSDVNGDRGRGPRWPGYDRYHGASERASGAESAEKGFAGVWCSAGHDEQASRFRMCQVVAFVAEGKEGDQAGRQSGRKARR